MCGVNMLWFLFCTGKNMPSAFGLKYKQAQLSLGSVAHLSAAYILCAHREAILCHETLPSLWHRRIRAITSHMGQMPLVKATPRGWVATRCYFHNQQDSYFFPSV